MPGDRKHCPGTGLFVTVTPLVTEALLIFIELLFLSLNFDSRYLVFVSGLEIGPKCEQQFNLKLFVDMVTCHLGCPEQQAANANIAAVIVAGNSLSKDTQTKDSLTKAKYLTKNIVAGSVEAMKSLDDYLVQLAACTDVVVLSGEFDPCNYTLLQQPLHRCMFSHAARYPTLHCATNPYEAVIEGIRVLGTSGKPVQDIYRYSSLEDDLQLLTHLAATHTMMRYSSFSRDALTYCSLATRTNCSIRHTKEVKASVCSW
ncbi:hypothetical protein DPMN_010645 [Dreissena polymorpha]|uniref:DNA polymerase alpha/delta/epsilon subunit B domain-containing protein n=1 Tax=Dreissena polymorpha TaxID=45954 RepID=A0A9D4S177_DREPO|nr:hypothetical protein DPMN_010645 [Dreissena polymorpha]